METRDERLNRKIRRSEGCERRTNTEIERSGAEREGSRAWFSTPTNLLIS
jgi:hypothetical protein